MENIAAILITLYSVLLPSKAWYAPGEKLAVKIDSPNAVVLVLTDFKGLRINTDVPTRVEPGTSVDVRAMFPAMRVGTYLLYATPDAVPSERLTREYVGTPLVIQLRGDNRPGAASGVIVAKVEPLCVARLDTSEGPMTAAFYYDVAPNTVSNFIDLARGGFYDGLTFHRVVPNFVVQAGDPLGDGSGGPGYQINAEFNSRPHLEGVLSMAREGDPMETQGAMPRAEYANTGGSQFFICLNYEKTRRLDRKYTAFGQLVNGLQTLQKIGAAEVADAGTGRPKAATTIRSMQIVPVKAGEDPYPTVSPEEQTRMDAAEAAVDAATQAVDPTTVPAN
jgi:peptidyl-prolyl cis-trans isomerase B (cyclophilin B)